MILAASLVGGSGSAETSASRTVPSRELPVPDTVSPEMQQAIALPARTLYRESPSTAEEWKALATRQAGAVAQLEVYEGQSHGQFYLAVDAAESTELFVDNRRILRRPSAIEQSLKSEWETV